MLDGVIVAARVAVDALDPLVRSALSALLRDAGVPESEVEDASVVLFDPGSGRDLESHDVPVLALAADSAEADALLARGARGVVRRDLDPDALLAAVEALDRGLIVVDPGLVTFATGTPEPELDPLTPREQEVLELLAEGLTNRLVARRLDISEHTAKFHVNAILEKLGARSRTEAVVVAARRGLLTL